MKLRLSILLACLVGSGCVGTDFVDENPTANPQLSITPTTGAVIVSETVLFEGEYRDGFEMVVDSAQISWSSTDPSVATIDANGVATGVAPGSTTIVGEVDGTTSSPATLNVVADANQIARVEVSQSALTLSAGAMETLTATAFNLLDQPITPASLTWRSSDDAVATVDASGVVSAVATGTAQIVATADGVDSGPTVVTVPGRNKSGSFSPAPGSSYTVRGTGRLVESASGALTVEFDNDFVVSDGPDIQVYVSSTSNVTGSSTNLGLVKRLTGSQEYSVPSSVTFESVNYIIIHCVSFNVTFGSAEIQ